MVIAGAGDRLAPPKHVRLLWGHWDRPRIHWFPGNHLVHLDKGKYLRRWQPSRGPQSSTACSGKSRNSLVLSLNVIMELL